MSQVFRKRREIKGTLYAGPGLPEKRPFCTNCPICGATVRCFFTCVSFAAIVMVALWNRADHYIFALWLLLSFFLSFFSSPNLSRRRLNVYYTSTHGVALV